jgi:ATP-dependent DNA helicase RecQ
MSDHLPGLPGSGIIYALRQRDTELVSNWLRDRGISVAAYHAGMENSERERLESRLLQNDVKALVATVALGMGFDKPDLGFVIHYQSPSNLVAYYQQIGRAGRAIQDAVAVMFLGTEDDRIHEWFIDNARPPREEIETVLSALASGAMSERELEQKVNLRPARLKRVLATLSTETEAPIVRIGARFQLAPYPYQPNQGTLERLAAKRRRERSELVNLAETQSCLMVEVRRALGEGDPAPCGKCSNCTGSTVVPVVAQHRSIELAEEHLKSRVFPIEPRKRWPPKGALAEYGFAGNIDPSLRCSPGTCLSLWGDPGIAEWVQYDKREGQFREELLVAAAAAIRRAGWSPRPTWVCAVPSLRTGALVPQFAQSLADRLCLPYVPAVRKARETDQQKQQQNSFHQAANLDGAFRVDGVEPGPVILIDDTVDSRWTFTIISALLQAAGSGCVYPLALCSTASGDPDE